MGGDNRNEVDSTSAVYLRLCEELQRSKGKLIIEREWALARARGSEMQIKRLSRSLEDRGQMKAELFKMKREMAENEATLAQSLEAVEAAEMKMKELTQARDEALLSIKDLQAKLEESDNRNISQYDAVCVALAERDAKINELSKWNRVELRDRRETENEAVDLRQQINVLSSRLAEQELAVGLAKEARDVAVVAKAGVESKLEQCEATVHQALERLAACEKEIIEARNLAAEARMSKQGIEEELGHQLEASEMEQDRIREFLRNKVEEHADTRTCLSDAVEEVEHEKRNNQSLRDRVSELEKEIIEARNQAAEVKVSKQKVEEELRKHLEAREMEHERTRVYLREKVEEHADAQCLLSAAMEEVEHEKRNNQSLRNRVLELESSHAKASFSIAAERAQVKELQSKLEGLYLESEAVKQRSQENEDLRAQAEGRLAALAQECEELIHERDEWRRRAERDEEIAEWVGVAVEPSTPGRSSDVPSSAASSALSEREEMDGNLNTTVQALIEENAVLRAEIQRLLAAAAQLNRQQKED